MRILILAGILLATLAPAASAQTVESTVWLHDLVTKEGAYAGCHVTDANFATYRLTVTQGTTVKLNVRSFENNTSTHRASVEGSIQEAVVSPGGAGALQVTLSESGTFDVLCDGVPNGLQGVIVVRPGAAAETKEAPGVGAVAAIALLALVALARRA